MAALALLLERDEQVEPLEAPAEPVEPAAEPCPPPIDPSATVASDDLIECPETYDRQVTPWEINQYLTFF